MEDLFEFFINDSKKLFSGWDFSYITDTGRMVEFPLGWSYTSKIISKLRNVNKLLDMGTGGGEFLSLLSPLPPNTYATEGYEPNLPVAKERLEPLGVTVVKVEKDNILKFENGFFDLVINRHEEYLVSEVHRVLKQNGFFVTQQVGGKNCVDLNSILGFDNDFGMEFWNLGYAVTQLKEAGMKIIEKYDDFPKIRFFDIGAIIYYLKAVPWQIPDFTIDKYYDSLRKVHNIIQEQGFIDFKEHRFLIVAQKC